MRTESRIRKVAKTVYVDEPYTVQVPETYQATVMQTRSKRVKVGTEEVPQSFTSAHQVCQTPTLPVVEKPTVVAQPPAIVYTAAPAKNEIAIQQPMPMLTNIYRAPAPVMSFGPVQFSQLAKPQVMLNLPVKTTQRLSPIRTAAKAFTTVRRQNVTAKKK
jgi:hypothetical protein